MEQDRTSRESRPDEATDRGTPPILNRRISRLNIIQIIRSKLHDLDDQDYTFSHSSAVLLMIGFCAAAIAYLIWRILV